ncbi:MAG: hypothetical protein IK076_00175 [Bacteroidales bacterium]|nr:hypothetical protein [Bacteroidales bacterium]
MKRFFLIFLAFFIACFTAMAQDDGAQKQINKKNLVIKEWNTNAKGARTLDHTTVFSPEGRKIEETEYDTGGRQKWRKRFEYGADGKVSRELLYNENNRLVNFKKFEFNEFGRKKMQYTYDPKGRLISTKVFEYLSEDA